MQGKREYMEGKFTEKSLLFDRVRGDGRNFMEDGFGAVEMNCGRMRHR